jgi:hypothetical protein
MVLAEIRCYAELIDTLRLRRNTERDDDMGADSADDEFAP